MFNIFRKLFTREAPASDREKTPTNPGGPTTAGNTNTVAERILNWNEVLAWVEATAASRILELGLGEGDRARELIQAACRAQEAGAVNYQAVDLFEAGQGQPLREAYRRLRATGVTVRLIPAAPGEPLRSFANTVSNVDLLIVSAEWYQAASPLVWFFVPRMLHPASRIYVETPCQPPKDHLSQLRLLPRSELDALCGPPLRHAG